ncbi:hypothetical protein TNCV_2409341 [Trichonephila clavipes]|nr:hypothetical protein TNCV_2409341 [Trichonephila clavipes]
MDVLKSLNGWSKRLYGSLGMLLDVGSLAWDATSCPFSNVFQYGWPDEAVLDEVLCSTSTWMGEITERAKYFKAKFLWHLRPCFFSTDITEDFKSVSHF